MDGKRAEAAPRARVHDDVVGVLAERVEVEAVEERPDGIMLISIRLPGGITEQVRLATQEWVQLQLIALEAAQTGDGLVYVTRYI